MRILKEFFYLYLKKQSLILDRKYKFAVSVSVMYTLISRFERTRKIQVITGDGNDSQKYLVFSCGRREKFGQVCGHIHMYAV